MNCGGGGTTRGGLREGQTARVSPTVNPTITPIPKSTPVPTPKTSPTLMPLTHSFGYIATPTPTLHPPQQLTPTPTPPVPTCTPSPEGISMGDILQVAREISGNFDPMIPDALTGSTLSIREVFREAATYVTAVDPQNPVTGPLSFFAEVIPPVAFAYDFIYDQITDTGDYGNIPLNSNTVLNVLLYTSLFIFLP
jgi:hypothetical protein